MLSAGTTEADRQVTESPFHVPFHGSVDQSIYMVEEMKYLPVFFEKSDYRFVQSGKRLLSFIFSGVIHGTAVKDITAAITGRIIGNPFLISKTHHFDGKLPFLEIVGELLEFGKFA